MDYQTSRRIDDLHREMQRIRREMEQRPIIIPTADPGFWAKLTAKTSAATNRWKYSWSEVTWGMSGGILTYATPTNPRAGPVNSTGYAWNSTEMDNTGAQGGAGWEDQDLVMTSDTITIAAINAIGTANDGGELFPIVWLVPTAVSVADNFAYLFVGWNTPTLSI